MDITTAPLTVRRAPGNAAKTYDGQAFSGGNGLLYTGFVNNENESVLTGALVYGGTAQGAVAAGSYGITARGWPRTITTSPSPMGP